VHRHLRLEHRFLLDVDDVQVLLHHQQAVVQFEAAGNNLQQRGLAGAVATDQADALAGLQGELGVVEQRHMAEGQLGGGKGNDCHNAKRRGRNKHCNDRAAPLPFIAAGGYNCAASSP